MMYQVSIISDPFMEGVVFLKESKDESQIDEKIKMLLDQKDISGIVILYSYELGDRAQIIRKVE